MKGSAKKMKKIKTTAAPPQDSSTSNNASIDPLSGDHQGLV